MKKIFTLLIILLVLAGCASKGTSEGGYNAYREEYDEAAMYDGAGAANYATSGTYEPKKDVVSKIIVTGHMSAEIQVLEDFTKPMGEAVSKYGGYIQDSSTGKNYDGTRYYSATIRVPADKYQEFIDEIGQQGNVASYSESRNDITDSYYDVQERIKNLEAEKARVMEFYAQATTIEELMKIEERITDIQYEIDSKTTQIKNWNLLTSYSTLNISVKETKVYTETPVTFGEKLVRAAKNGFRNFISGIGDLILWIVESIWTLLLLAGIGYGIYRAIVWFRHRPSAEARKALRAEKKAKKEASKKAKKEAKKAQKEAENAPEEDIKQTPDNEEPVTIIVEDGIASNEIEKTPLIDMSEEVGPVTMDDVTTLVEDITVTKEDKDGTV